MLAAGEELVGAAQGHWTSAAAIELSRQVHV